MKIFVDTAPFIYLIENNPEFGEKVKSYISEMLREGGILKTSVITLMEFGVKPMKEDRLDVIIKFEELLEKLNIEIIDIDKEIATESYKLRAKYEFLKGMDALQIGTAIKNECMKFVTNDKKLSKIKEIEIVLITDL